MAGRLPDPDADTDTVSVESLHNRKLAQSKAGEEEGCLSRRLAPRQLLARQGLLNAAGK